MLFTSLVLSMVRLGTPLDFARREIDALVGSRGANVSIAVKPSLGREAYSISGDGKHVRIVGGDATGAMYGAFEFAERVHQKGAPAWKTSVAGKPYLKDRGVNLFLTLPWDYKKNDTDYDVAALTDPKRWWFQNEDYWTTLLDLMAHSRLNWLDIHGAWDISVTNAPNLYAYFVISPSFPQVGVPADVKAKDLAKLNHVIDMAHARGIRVSLMCYEANLKIPQNPSPHYQASEANVYKYTKEVVEQMIRRAPGLDAIGFRIGESGRSESFFNCYHEAVKASGRDIPLITRSWITRKQKVLPLARASKDFTVEIKYNGEQWGAPYMVAGGRMANWGSYSYEDYLSDSNVARASRPSIESRAARGQDALATVARMWPGNPVQLQTRNSKLETERWPSEPYKIVWQVRANGTHRIFPFYSPDMVRQTIQTMKIGTASGYTVEGEDAYFPKSPDYYLAHPETDKYCDWIHQRDEMYWMCWGRLGYDPTVKNDVFESDMSKWFGNSAPLIASAWADASARLSRSFVEHALGPDHRDHAPELETGGGLAEHLEGESFDSFAHSKPSMHVALTSLGLPDSIELAPRTDIYEWYAIDLTKLSDSTSRRYEELRRSSRAMANVAHFHDSYLDAASKIGLSEANDGHQGISGDATWALRDALKSWQDLSRLEAYRPFTDKLRMHTNSFHWRGELAKVEADTSRLLALPSNRTPKELGRQDPVFINTTGPPPSAFWTIRADSIRCYVRYVHGASLLVKPLASSTFFHRIPMQPTKEGWAITIPRPRCGLCVAVEVKTPYGYERIGNAGKPVGDSLNQQPYKVIPAQSGTTPQIYAADEAMTFLDPKILTPSKFGAMLIGTRSGQFFGRFDRATKRKLLAPVERGMRLIILQEDFGKDKLDFLPKPLRFEAANSSTFDPAGQLGLQKVETPDIMWQRFLPSEGWEVFGNGGLARLKLGKGEVWVTSARLMQRMIIPGAAKDFAKMLSLGGKTKPTVLIDSGSEGGPLTTSCHPDLMNALGIPFLTLGEVIAQEQGMNSFTPIPGPVMGDDVLGGKGTEMANKFLRDQVIAMSKRPTPSNLPDFEKVRKERKKELMRSLGLDPMPPRTPLNARITGTIQRDGYHIEKLVFESRPRFFVTAHVYVPDEVRRLGGEEVRKGGGPLAGDATSSQGASSLPPYLLTSLPKRLPVIMNVNGHWAHKKDEDRIQLRCAFQARQGYIAIAIDSPGHSFEGDSLIERRAEGDHNDWQLVDGGTNTTGYYVWDAIRALDYMATRPDTDMTRVGITGASGGGLATLYAFAADDRYKAAVPVVYMASMELAPDNGCLCNHVPGTCQIGDRSDVIAVQAPKPVYLMGAQNDGEFPPDATRLTQKKMAESWKLFGKDKDTYVQIFPGGHDYNQAMREASIGFFNKHLKGEGDGSPVPQPPLTAIDPEDHQLLAADPPIPNERTMRDLSLEYLDHAPLSVPIKQVFDVNGGIPNRTPLNYKETGQGQTKTVTFESEPGLVTPGVRTVSQDRDPWLSIVVSDKGNKASSWDSLPVSRSSEMWLFLDILGTGELAGIDMRYPFYTGRGVAFTGGWQIVRAAEAMRRYSKHIILIADGPISSQAAMYAALIDPSFESVEATGCLKKWQDVFSPNISPYAVQPRAHLCGSLDNLRAKVKNGHWSFDR